MQMQRVYQFPGTTSNIVTTHKETQSEQLTVNEALTTKTNQSQ